ncbi:unnamed protein product [Staurois parvus]|uniref:Uncharacterized protein n=1 Tax=Staurois parvus TaxID=386267 RepID=A0ABN9CAW2_9NEOB|nr:unnamed protein product [Staurois parvus]
MTGLHKQEKYRSAGNSQTRPSDCQTEKNDLSLQRTRFPLQSPVVMCFTPLHPTLCIALDVRLGCSCLAMETHSMKLSMHYCANLKDTPSLEVFSY